MVYNDWSGLQLIFMSSSQLSVRGHFPCVQFLFLASYQLIVCDLSILLCLYFSGFSWWNNHWCSVISSERQHRYEAIWALACSFLHIALLVLVLCSFMHPRVDEYAGIESVYWMLLCLGVLLVVYCAPRLRCEAIVHRQWRNSWSRYSSGTYYSAKTNG